MFGLTLETCVSDVKYVGSYLPNWELLAFNAPNYLTGSLRTYFTDRQTQSDENIISANHYVYLAGVKISVQYVVIIRHARNM